MSDRTDLDPRLRGSPRLFADPGTIPHARTSSSLIRSTPTETQLARMRRDMAIYLAIEGGMSFRMVGKIFELTPPGALKAYRRMVRRKSRA